MQFKLKARLALSGIAVIAIVAGTYAFKARENNSICIRGVGTTICNIEVFTRTLTGIGMPISTTYATNPRCPATCPKMVPIYTGM